MIKLSSPEKATKLKATSSKFVPSFKNKSSVSPSTNLSWNSSEK